MRWVFLQDRYVARMRREAETRRRDILAVCAFMIPFPNAVHGLHALLNGQRWMSLASFATAATGYVLWFVYAFRKPKVRWGPPAREDYVLQTDEPEAR
jgi:hypothetical protein